MIVSQIASLAHTASVELTICMSTQLSFLNAAFRVIAILAHTARIVMVIDVLTLSYLFTVFDFALLFYACGVFRCFLATLVFGLYRCLRGHYLLYCHRHLGAWRLFSLFMLERILIPHLLLLFYSVNSPSLFLFHLFLTLLTIPSHVVEHSYVVGLQMHWWEASRADGLVYC